MSYYAERLAGERLRSCYEVAPPRVKRYLEAEIRHVVERIRPGDTVLEVGCGYGRVAFELARHAAGVVGVDTAKESLALARTLGGNRGNCEFLEMDALELEFGDDTFDLAACVQNGICAFGVDQDRLLSAAVRVTRPGGRVLLSSYADSFWPHRLQWFEVQAEHGLMGEVDRRKSGDGVIVCRDGFRAGAMSAEQFRELASRAGLSCEIRVVDRSSVFCEIVAPAGAPA